MTTNVLLLYTEVGRYMLDSLYTEAPAAALLAIGSLFLSSAIVQRRVLLMLLAGVCFGLLALVKAAFLYIVPGIVILMPFATLVNRRQIPVIPLIRLAIVLVMAFFVVVAPWMYRNYLSLGTFSITSRGGEALYNRALLNQMTVEEYFGSLSLWAPYPLNGALRRILGISREDLENGVRLQRLGESADSKWAKADFAAELAGRPEDAHTFYRQVGAERVKLINEFRAAGHPEPELAADGVLRERAMQMISRHPLRHLANTFSNLWRGAFFSLPLLLIAMAYAWRHKHLELLMLIVPAVAMILFYGAVSAFTPRYALPAYPLAICSGVVLCGLLARRQAPQAASQ
jgi:4-amino-4-deoxy-L-arabinose transferase-like glycosyltransferase